MLTRTGFQLFEHYMLKVHEMSGTIKIEQGDAIVSATRSQVMTRPVALLLRRHLWAPLVGRGDRSGRRDGAELRGHFACWHLFLVEGHHAGECGPLSPPLCATCLRCGLLIAALRALHYIVRTRMRRWASAPRSCSTRFTRTSRRV